MRPDPAQPATSPGRHPLLEQYAREDRAEAWPDTTRLHRAFMLAPTLEICEALLRGEHVPAELLDPHWVARYGLRRP